MNIGDPQKIIQNEPDLISIPERQPIPIEQYEIKVPVKILRGGPKIGS